MNCTVEELFLKLVSYGGGTVALLFSGLAMLLAWKMINFTGKYNRQWKRSFMIFFSTTAVAFVRRVVAGLLLVGYDGTMGKLLNITDKAFLMPVFSILYAWFVWENYSFWKTFSHQFLETFKEKK